MDLFGTNKTAIRQCGTCTHKCERVLTGIPDCLTCTYLSGCKDNTACTTCTGLSKNKQSTICGYYPKGFLTLIK